MAHVKGIGQVFGNLLGRMNLKPIAIILIIAIVLNLILFAFKAINQFWFWIIIIVIAFVAYKVMPKLK